MSNTSKLILILCAVVAGVCSSGCARVSPHCAEPWVFPDARYRTIHFRADQGRWLVWQYQDTWQEARHHQAYMNDLFSVTESYQPTAIQTRPDTLKREQRTKN
jgi:hypothetical protein